jgi:hypothetical protein
MMSVGQLTGSWAGGGPLADPIAEGRRIVRAAGDGSALVRLTGGVGIACVCPTALKPPLRRVFKDIDIVGLASQRKQIVGILESLGYQPDRQFNAVNGATRLLLQDPVNGRQLDVFLDEVNLCHRIDLRDRLSLTSPSLSVSDLLLMKLQVFETNMKDYSDIAGICADHDVGQDPLGVDLAYFGRLAGNDWGLWRTLTIVAERARLFARDLQAFDAGHLVEARLQALLTHLEQVPKSRKWTMRAAIGERKRWYNLPE